MKTLHFPPTKVSHTSKTPHSKSLEPDCLSPLIAITTQSPEGEVEVGAIPDGEWQGQRIYPRSSRIAALCHMEGDVLHLHLKNDTSKVKFTREYPVQNVF
jgi:hypothetical protein